MPPKRKQKPRPAIAFRLSESEQNLLRARAEEAGYDTVTRYVKAACLERPVEAVPRAPSGMASEVRDAVRELSQVGNLLASVAHNLRGLWTVTSFAESRLEAELNELAKIRKLVLTLREKVMPE